MRLYFRISTTWCIEYSLLYLVSLFDRYHELRLKSWYGQMLLRVGARILPCSYLKSGTGVGQVHSNVVLTSKYSQTILIDEPIVLHPGLHASSSKFLESSRSTNTSSQPILAKS